MRKARNPYNAKRMLVRMSWHPQNLYNLYHRTFGPRASETAFARSNRSLFAQRWRSKAVLRGYHGDWIPEQKFKQHWLPANLPRVPPRGPAFGMPRGGVGQGGEETEDRTPVTSMMFGELEKRLDVAVFRACFADSVYEARRMVIHGGVTLNGVKCTSAWTRLNPGDLVWVDPKVISMLSETKTWPTAKYGNPYVFDGKTEKEKRREAEAATKATEVAEEAAETRAEATAGAAVTHVSAEEAGPSKATAEASSGSSTSAAPGPAAFRLPPYASPFLFIPPHILPSFRLTSFIFLRAPTAGPGYTEIPSPWNADGEVVRLAWEWYVKRGLGRRVRKERREKERRRSDLVDEGVETGKKEGLGRWGEWWIRKDSAGGRVGTVRRGGAVEGARIGAASEGPKGDPRYYDVKPLRAPKARMRVGTEVEGLKQCPPNLGA